MTAKTFYRLMHDPRLHLGVGAFVALAGIWEAARLGIEQAQEVHLRAPYGLILLGFINFLISLEHAMHGFEAVGHATSRIRHRPGTFHLISDRLLSGRGFELLMGLALIVVGFAEERQRRAMTGTAADEVWWHYGLIVLGTFNLCRALTGFAARVVETRGARLHRLPGVLKNLEEFLLRSHVEAVVGVALVVLGVWQAVKSSGLGFGAHWALVVHGSVVTAHTLSEVVVSVDLEEDALELERADDAA